MLDAMVDGREYESIVSKVPASENLAPEIQRAITELETVRQRPCLVYASNLIQPGAQHTDIRASDHLPFAEMVAQVPLDERRVDIFLVTPGGSASQVNLFVDVLRPRFDAVDFLIPYKAMSAGTLWALSGDEIWMDERAFLGPVDPQVPAKDGQYVPALALITLLSEIQRQGQLALQKGENPPWSLIRLLDQMDQKQVGAALSAQGYVSTLSAQYLEQYKFRRWVTHSKTGEAVTDAERAARADKVAKLLGSHDRWKAHGHAISRAVLSSEVGIRISKPEDVQGLQRAMRRLWALLYYTFDKAQVVKLIMSTKYSVFRLEQVQERK